MSHDRGCSCGREQWDYADCPKLGCWKREGPPKAAKKEAQMITTKLITCRGQHDFLLMVKEAELEGYILEHFSTTHDMGAICYSAFMRRKS